MTIHLDHAIVPARDKLASAKRLAELLGVPRSDPDRHQWELLTVSYAPPAR